MMNTLRFVVVIALAISPAWALAQDSEGGFQLSSWGIINLEQTGDGLGVGWTRLYPEASFGPWKLVAEVEFGGYDKADFGDWLHQIKVERKISDSVTVGAGRFFASGGYFTVAPFAIDTARYPDGYPLGGFYV